MHAAPLRAVLVLTGRAARLQLPPGGSQGMDSTTRGLTKYLKGYYTWYMKNSLILFSLPPFVQATNFRTEPAKECLYFKVSPVHCHRFTSTWGHFHLLTSPVQTGLHGKQFWPDNAAATSQRQPFCKAAPAIASASRGMEEFRASGIAILVYFIDQCFRKKNPKTPP